MKKTLHYVTVLLVFLTVIVGCSGNKNTGEEPGTPVQPSGNPVAEKPEPKPAEEKPQAPPSPPVPATLTMYNHFNNISDARIEQFILEPLKQKLPHITFQVVKHGTGSTITDLVAANSFTDFYYGSNVGFPAYMNLDLQYDMNELIKKYNLDLSRFDSNSIDAIRNFGPNGEIYGIPFSANFGIMIYNKDIFDKFGVDYPVDGMTWDEVLDLSRNLTRKDGDVQYIGFDPGNPAQMGSGLALPFVDINTKTALVDNEHWRNIFSVFKRAYEIPNYVNEGKFDYGTNGFIKDQIVAMLPIWALQVVNTKNDLAGMNWDIVSLPNLPGHVGKGREVDIHMMAISTVSKNKDAAMEVLNVVTSDEVQMLMSQYGTPSILNNEEIKKNYGISVPEFKDKNMQALFKTKPQVPHIITKYDSEVSGRINGARKDISQGKDINTLIREIEESANSKLAEMD